MRSGLLVLDRQECEPIGVLIVALACAVGEEQYRAQDEQEAHEDL
ncbi:hypothetical protein [Polyangium fumosum]|nr:hypothetical protein [Polyangium fumosum]